MTNAFTQQEDIETALRAARQLLSLCLTLLSDKKRLTSDEIKRLHSDVKIIITTPLDDTLRTDMSVRLTQLHLAVIQRSNEAAT